ALLALLEAQAALAQLELGGLDALAAREALAAQLAHLVLARAHVGRRRLEAIARPVGLLARAVLLAQLRDELLARLRAGRGELRAARLHLLDLALAARDPGLRLARRLRGARAGRDQAVALLDARGVRDAALGEGRLAALQLASGLPDPRGERIERTLGVDALDAERLQALGQRSLLGADGLAL